MFTELQENFVGFESFFELNSWHSSYVRQTWMAQLILAKFLCGELSSFYPRGFCYSYAYMHIWFYRFCKRVTCFCTRLIFRKHLELLFMFLTGFIQFLLFYLPVTFFVDSFDAISINMQEILSVNPSANVVVFGDFNVHHKHWMTYSGRTDWPSKSCHNFFISNELTQRVKAYVRYFSSNFYFFIKW